MVKDQTQKWDSGLSCFEAQQYFNIGDNLCPKSDSSSSKESLLFSRRIACLGQETLSTIVIRTFLNHYFCFAVLFITIIISIGDFHLLHAYNTQST
jgi:hypothetical protein